MAITAYFYKTGKKINSTKQIAQGIGDIELSCELKDVTNLLAPTLIISSNTFLDQNNNIQNPLDFVYCYIPDFNRRYFVRDWSWIVGRWECSLEVDVLATYKTAVGNTTAFVLRSASQYDPDIIDTKYPTTMTEAAALQEESSFGNTTPWNTDIKTATIDQGFYVISVVNADLNTIGGVSYYAMSAAVMSELMNKLFSAPTWMGITDASISSDLQKMLFNPMQYITNIMWIPRGFSTTNASTTNTLPFGWWSITLSGTAYRLNVDNTALEFTISCSMKYHPQYDSSKRRWLQLSPFTTCALYLPPFGFVPIDTTKIYLSDKIKARVRIDVITGMGTLFISHSYTENNIEYDGGIIYTTVSQVGVPMSIAQMAIDWNAISSASTWVAAAGVSLASGALQDSLNNFKNGLIDGAKDIFNDLKSSFQRPAYNPNTETLALLVSRGLDKGVASVQGNNAAKPNLGGSGSSLLSSVKEMASNIGSTALAAAGQCSSSGSTGGFACLQEKPFVEFYFMLIAGVDDAHNGLPLCRSTKINNLSGFVLCGNTDDFSADCTPAERQAVCALMEAGFYYE